MYMSVYVLDLKLLECIIICLILIAWLAHVQSYIKLNPLKHNNYGTVYGQTSSMQSAAMDQYIYIYPSHIGNAEAMYMYYYLHIV